MFIEEEHKKNVQKFEAAVDEIKTTAEEVVDGLQSQLKGASPSRCSARRKCVVRRFGFSRHPPSLSAHRGEASNARVSRGFDALRSPSPPHPICPPSLLHRRLLPDPPPPRAPPAPTTHRASPPPRPTPQDAAEAAPRACR